MDTQNVLPKPEQQTSMNQLGLKREKKQHGTAGAPSLFCLKILNELMVILSDNSSFYLFIFLLQKRKSTTEEKDINQS